MPLPCCKTMLELRTTENSITTDPRAPEKRPVQTMPNAKSIADLPSVPVPIILPPDMDRVTEVFENLAEQYGSRFTVRLAGQPMLVITDTESINYMLRKRPEIFAPYRKKTELMEAMKIGSIEAADGAIWKHQRDVLATALDSRNLTRYLETIGTVSEELKTQWLNLGNRLGDLDLEAEIFRYSTSVFTKILFGDMGDLPERERVEIIKQFDSLVDLLSARINALLPQMHLNNYNDDSDFGSALAEFFELIRNRIAHSRESLAGPADTQSKATLLQALLESAPPGDFANRDLKLVENVITLLLAAEPTTARALYRVILRIAADSSLQQEIQAEVDYVGGPGGAVASIEDIKKLRVIEAVILETLRISSVSRFALAEARDDTSVGSLEIPRGTPVMLLFGNCGLDESNFVQPRVFDHRRWLGEAKTGSGRHNNKAFLGFGAGPRSCPGRGLAMLVMKRALAMIFGNFVVRLVSAEAGPVPAERRAGSFSPSLTLAPRDAETEEFGHAR